MSAPRKVTVLGSTGSIGCSTLSLLEESVASGAAAVDVVALTGGRNVERLVGQALRWRPEVAVVADEQAYGDLKAGLAGTGIEAAAGSQAVREAAGRPSDWIMAAIVGSAGLAPAFAAAKTGAVLAIANKESIVCAGPALIEQVRRAGGTLVPVDSEHSALFQVLHPDQLHRVAKLVLTASGGPFRTKTLDDMRSATPEAAVAHPNWSMGVKNSVDSATLMNKGLEMIEAAYLFDTPEHRIDVVVHPESIVHSLVEFVDGSVLAQLGLPDMRLAIQYALTFPERLPSPRPRLSLTETATLHFERPDLDRFHALRLAREAGEAGGTYPTVLSAADDVAVDAFLAGRLRFVDIPDVVSDVLAAHLTVGPLTLEAIAEADAWSRIEAERTIARRR